MNNKYLLGFVLVCLSGVVWSFGSTIVRLMEDAENYRIPYLFYRGFAICTTITLYIFLRDRREFFANFKRIDRWAVSGAILLMLSMFGFIFSLTITTVAVTLLMLALAPLFSAVFGYLLLGEKLSRTTIINMGVVIIGVVVMIWNVESANTIIGALYGMFSAFCFAMYTITIRHNPETPKLLTPALSGLMGIVLTCVIVLVGNDLTFDIPQINIQLSVFHGTIVGAGLVLYGLGAKYLPSAELVLLTLLEVVVGIFWAWLPIIGINEVPDLNTLVGGLIMLGAITVQGLATRKRHGPVIH
ncbi:MAG: DMT family transporter [Gammaproteobacteria bacterium]|nr:DMT family transporter [Gammaproteobacteria bacterium]